MYTLVWMRNLKKILWSLWDHRKRKTVEIVSIASEIDGSSLYGSMVWSCADSFILEQMYGLVQMRSLENSLWSLWEHRKRTRDWHASIGGVDLLRCDDCLVVSCRVRCIFGRFALLVASSADSLLVRTRRCCLVGAFGLWSGLTDKDGCWGGYRWSGTGNDNIIHNSWSR